MEHHGVPSGKSGNNQIPCLVPPGSGAAFLRMADRTLLEQSCFTNALRAVWRYSSLRPKAVGSMLRVAQLAKFFFVQYVANASRQPA